MTGEETVHREVANGRCSACRYAQGGAGSWWNCPRNPKNAEVRDA